MQKGDDAFLSEFLTTRVHCFNQPVSENQQPVAGLQSYLATLVLSISENSQRQAARFETFDRARGSPYHRRVVSGVDINQLVCRRI